jgi:hypothetical protein
MRERLHCKEIVLKCPLTSFNDAASGVHDIEAWFQPVCD